MEVACWILRHNYGKPRGVFLMNTSVILQQSTLQLPLPPPNQFMTYLDLLKYV